MIRVGIPVVIHDNAWMGGLNYFLSLLSVINEYNERELEVFVLTNRSDIFNNIYRKHIKIIQADFLLNRSERVRNLCRHFETDIRLAYYSKIYKLDVITHALPGKRFTANTLYWMPDFQHCHLPQLFSDIEIENRNKNIELVGNRCSNILLSSHAAESDFRKFYPHLGHVKSHVMNFTPNIEIESIKKHKNKPNNISENFYYVPNQFWVHKNHDVIIDALSLLPPEIKVYCTGNTSDIRNPEHFKNIERKIINSGLKDRFVVLGLVDRNEMISLLLNCLAVINPSYFEGWSSTVEEAKCLGKKLILSDIPVHREQAPIDALYFPAEDPISLANHLQNVWQNRDEEKQREKARYIESIKQYQLSREIFAKKYKSIVHAMLTAKN
ncbi:glycosyltransferase family 4 protein [Bowmanella yangjiangensis]|uniref:Glycosyltransferase family 4 protein n=1 Tax=Bowmanella yangjiangensis TaxID=2811230 RepID=A0ABS3CP46_9ALTE|nr:glycosyltransferase family 1 protein [Bowmanella yangjiangensis]MBN7818869.1 glycosyltransferase family 4 protein [Bowmanella yangjiangensis]